MFSTFLVCQLEVCVTMLHLTTRSSLLVSLLSRTSKKVNPSKSGLLVYDYRMHKGKGMASKWQRAVWHAWRTALHDIEMIDDKLPVWRHDPILLPSRSKTPRSLGNHGRSTKKSDELIQLNLTALGYKIHQPVFPPSSAGSHFSPHHN